MLKGSGETAEASQLTASHASTREAPGPAVVPGYGRARLLLGISAVGTIVAISALGLSLDVPGRMQALAGPTALGQVVALLGFVLVYAAVQLPFDLLGGYLLPRRFARSHPPLATYLVGLTRGVAAQAAVLFVVAVALTLAGRGGGAIATAGVGLLTSLALLRWRVHVASAAAPFEFTPMEPTTSEGQDPLSVRLARSREEGFTGAIVGVFRPRFQILPARWRDALGPRGFEVAVRRRTMAVESGSWRRGRTVAILFTGVGLALAAGLARPAGLGTAGGTVAFSFWFSLWSFLGLLTLPTLSRRGVIEVDERARGDGATDGELAEAARRLDALQDGEPARPGLVEAIFHPIPSVANRLDATRPRGSIGCWDAARTSVYLSLAGVGLLGRAVHCNCGRPALWVFLPTD